MKSGIRRRLRDYVLQARMSAQAKRVRLLTMAYNHVLDDFKHLKVPAPKHDMKLERENSDQKLKKAMDEELYKAVGRALSTWVMLEDMLIRLAALLLGISYEKTGIVFYSIINFGTWLSIISELLTLSPEYKHKAPTWNKISGRCRGLKDTRDRLAHHTSKDYLQDGQLVPRISASEYDLRSKTTKYKALSSNEIWIFAAEITQVSSNISLMLVDLLHDVQIPLPEKSLEQEVDPPQS